MIARGRRAGIALVAALSLLALLGLLIAGAVASTAAAQRSVRLAITEGTTAAAADYALATVLSDPAGFGVADAPLGRAATWVIPPSGAGGVPVTVAVTRLANGVVWLVADAAVAGVDQGHRRLGLVARFPWVGALPAAGLTAAGAVSTGGALLSSDSSGDADCARGPAVPWVQATDSASFYLTARQVALLDSAAGVRHVRGDTTITGGTFTGILVVDGALVVSGNWSANGLIVARGPVRVTGTIAVTGALMSSGAGTSIDLAGGTIRYAPCIVAREIRSALPPVAVPGRSWSELF